MDRSQRDRVREVRAPSPATPTRKANFLNQPAGRSTPETLSSQAHGALGREKGDDAVSVCAQENPGVSPATGPGPAEYSEPSSGSGTRDAALSTELQVDDGLFVHAKFHAHGACTILHKNAVSTRRGPSGGRDAQTT
ncbi:hypothetical protein OH76DRAFT_830953 [Lentinus brumalis]|uniref:Uncharacterized protein n=1 Tax=Lentinus brumalis TaxID=2498619 RepID=A0A371D205_9APHY|nr:hypothetical protein OH76DRAFT_830953 [Polyporus brumalis]